MNIKLTSDLVLIRRLTDESPKTSWGFELPKVEESADTPWRGEVAATGPGKLVKISPAGESVVDALKSLVDSFHRMPNINWGSRGFPLQLFQQADDALKGQAGSMTRAPMQVRVGDIVVFSKNLYQEFKLDGTTYIATHEDSILGVLE